MYGFIHCALHDLVTQNFGEEAWRKILKTAGIELEGGSYLIHNIYTDEETLKLVGASCSVLGLPLDAILEKFGEHFFQYCVQSGYDRILRVLGRNLREFLCNLDALHDHLASIYQGINAPSFRTTDCSDGSLLLHYYSAREGLGNIVVGIVKTVAKEILNTTVDMHILQDKTKEYDHMIFVIETEQASNGKQSHSHMSLDFPTSSRLKLGTTGQLQQHRLRSQKFNSFMTVASFCRCFPFHIVFDRSLIIRQFGVGLRKYFTQFSSKDDSRKLIFTNLFQLSRPRMQFSFNTILAHINTVFVVVSRNSCGRFRRISPTKPCGNPGSSGSGSVKGPADELRLKGQMIYASQSDCIIFLCSPRFGSLEELSNAGILLSDIPVHDATRELLLTAHAYAPARELVGKLEESSNDLRKLQARLIEDKKNTDDLLHEILPKKVAAKLRLNEPVPGETYKLVTILFSDIVGFTSLCSSEKVVPMDIVKLLNKLYTYFDMMTGFHDVYKVETIGDAYMVVGGLPTSCEDHADKVANMACSMLDAVTQVHSPVDAQPIKIRIGLHSGSVMAGVVGQKMPRYCLFGSSVTIANQMEAGSLPGKINVSNETKRHLENCSNKWEFEENTSPNLIPCYFLHRCGQNISGAAFVDIQQRTSAECLLKSPSSSPAASPRIRSRFMRSSSISSSSLGNCPFSNIINGKSMGEVHSKDGNTSRCEEIRNSLKKLPVTSPSKTCTPTDHIKVD